MILSTLRFFGCLQDPTVPKNPNMIKNESSQPQPDLVKSGMRPVEIIGVYAKHLVTYPDIQSISSSDMRDSDKHTSTSTMFDAYRNIETSTPIISIRTSTESPDTMSEDTINYNALSHLKKPIKQVGSSDEQDSEPLVCVDSVKYSKYMLRMLDTTPIQTFSDLEEDKEFNSYEESGLSF